MQINRHVSHLLDYVFCEYVISILCILAWRGVYKFLDVHLYAEDETRSAIASLTIGFCLYFLLMYTQPWHGGLCQLIPFLDLNFPRFVENLRHICAFGSYILMWRGFWIFFDAAVLTVPLFNAHHATFYVVAMLASFLILTVMSSASSTNGPMSQMDDALELFPVYRNCFLAKWFGETKRSVAPESNSRKMTDDNLYTITIF